MRKINYLSDFEVGLTLTDAVNLFIQQSLNVGGLPFEVRAPGAKLSKEKALEILLEKLETTDGKYDPPAKE